MLNSYFWPKTDSYLYLSMQMLVPEPIMMCRCWQERSGSSRPGVPRWPGRVGSHALRAFGATPTDSSGIPAWDQQGRRLQLLKGHVNSPPTSPETSGGARGSASAVSGTRDRGGAPQCVRRGRSGVSSWSSKTRSQGAEGGPCPDARWPDYPSAYKMMEM